MAESKIQDGLLYRYQKTELQGELYAAYKLVKSLSRREELLIDRIAAEGRARLQLQRDIAGAIDFRAELARLFDVPIEEGELADELKTLLKLAKER